MSVILYIVSLVLLVSSTPSLDISWNIFNTSETPEFSYIGYGDWCAANEGAHPGIDFKDPSPDTCSTVVVCMATDTCYVRDFRLTSSRSGHITGWTLFFLVKIQHPTVPGRSGISTGLNTLKKATRFYQAIHWHISGLLNCQVTKNPQSRIRPGTGLTMFILCGATRIVHLTVLFTPSTT